jgi:hypothetical protein
MTPGSHEVCFTQPASLVAEAFLKACQLHELDW